jgi:hypothetical protein
MSSNVREGQYTLIIIFHSVLLTIRNVSDKLCREYQNINFMFNNFFFFENCAVREIMWKDSAEPGMPQMTIWRMHISFWIPKTTNAHSIYVILIDFDYNSDYTNAPLCYAAYIAYLVKYYCNTDNDFYLCRIEIYRTE